MDRACTSYGPQNIRDVQHVSVRNELEFSPPFTPSHASSLPPTYAESCSAPTTYTESYYAPTTYAESVV